jgi:CRISPR system Cascade subunit CasE
MAFPSEERKSDDGHFLESFNPDDFGKGQVHVKRADDSGFLFRIDPEQQCCREGSHERSLRGRVVILVQSAQTAVNPDPLKPDWDYAFQNAPYLLAARPEVKEFNPSFVKGQRLRFRLLANPTKKIDTIRQEERQRHTKEELRQIEGRNGRRVPVPSSEELRAWREKNPKGDERTFISLRLLDWLAEWRVRPDESPGFSIDNDSTTVQAGYVYVNKARDGEGNRLRSVRYQGVLQVTDPDKFRNTLLRGIGAGKAFGFGLLSVAPCQAPLAADDRLKTLEGNDGTRCPEGANHE